MKQVFVFWTFIFCSGMASLTFGQLSYGKYIVDTLCHPTMQGRGYYQKGDSIAADFLVDEYNRLGVQSFDEAKDFLQPFTLPVNSIDGKVELTINKRQLVPGKDYIVSPASPSVDGDFKIYMLDTSVLHNKSALQKSIAEARGKYVVIFKDGFSDPRLISGVIQSLHRERLLPIAGVISVSSQNLIYTASQTKAPRPLIEIDSRHFSDTNFKKLRVLIESTYDRSYEAQNVLGYIEGEIKDTFVCVSAHYDHLGRMGHDIYFPGANDNASGTAMMLSLAQKFAKEKPKYSIAFFAFGAEEIGLVGSKHYVDNPMFPLKNIKFLLNLDILGTGDDGIQIVNSAIYKDHYVKMKTINSLHNLLKQIKVRGERCNSDHCFFHENGVPSFFIYTLGGIAHYHNIYDKSDTLPLTEFEDLHHLLVKFVEAL